MKFFRIFSAEDKQLFNFSRCNFSSSLSYKFHSQRVALIFYALCRFTLNSFFFRRRRSRIHAVVQKTHNFLRHAAMSLCGFVHVSFMFTSVSDESQKVSFSFTLDKKSRRQSFFPSMNESKLFLHIY